MWKVAVVAVVGVTLLASCTADAPEVRGFPTLSEEASAEQIAAVEDYQVSEEEYTAGYRRFSACMAESGYPVDDLGRPSTVYEFGYSEAAADSGVFTECYEEQFQVIDILWQEANPPWTDAAPRLVACLDEAGLPTGGNEEELKQRMTENGLDVVACILGMPPYGTNPPYPEEDE